MSTLQNQKSEIGNQKLKNDDFEFREDGDHAGIYHNGEKILRLETHDRLTIKDQCMEPGADPELAWIHLLPSSGIPIRSRTFATTCNGSRADVPW